MYVYKSIWSYPSVRPSVCLNTLSQ